MIAISTPGNQFVTRKRFGHHRSMTAEPDVVRLARTMGDATRIRMLNLLMEGRALTAKELAYGSGVGPATGTAHLQRLLADALVAVRVQGRHKYFRLASPAVAHCLETMMSVAIPAKPAGEKRPAIQQARFCYDHLAGRLGVAITHALVFRKLLHAGAGAFTLSRKGKRWCDNFGIDLNALYRSRRQFAPQCLDWSERKEHIGGALGSAIAQRFLNQGWATQERDSRVVRLSRLGIRRLNSEFGIRWSD
jgi:DNA-binding transcriptional ArsR family regulator